MLLSVLKTWAAVSAPFLTVPVQLFFAELLFLKLMERRSRFYLRLLLMLALTVGVGTMLMPEPDLFSATMHFFCVSLLTVAEMLFCFSGGSADILFACLAGYCTQNMACSIYQMFLVLPLYTQSEVFALFHSSVVIPAVCILLYTGVYRLVSARFRSLEAFRSVTGVGILGLSAVVLFLTIILNWMVGMEPGSSRVFIGGKLLMILCEVLLLTLQLDLLERGKLRMELETIQHLWQRDQAHYQIGKDSIDIINYKYHDLKHIVQSGADQAGTAFLKEADEAAQIYDAIYHTGNEALDVVLTEKGLSCRRNGIRLTCIVDGEALRFISEVNLYSIIGNALDNAIESVIRLDDSSKKRSP